MHCAHKQEDAFVILTLAMCSAWLGVTLSLLRGPQRRHDSIQRTHVHQEQKTSRISQQLVMRRKDPCSDFLLFVL